MPSTPLALITKLKLICNYDDRSKESVKLDYLKEELEELTEDGKKALIFSQFPNETLKKIEPDLHEYKPFIYDGSLSDKKRTQYVDDFQNLDENRIMMLSSKAGNAGITLTRANYVYHFDLWWNPAVAAQSLGRALRIGQKEKVVFERYLLTKGTIEERIYLKVQEKRQLFDRIVDDLSDETTIARNFTDDEIFGLLGLKNPKNLSPTNATETFANVPFELKTQYQIDAMEPLEFEEFICTLYEKMGYHAQLTQKSYDGGVDIIAKRQAASGYEEVVIQCKHKENSGDAVGVDKVRELSGALKDYNSSAKAVLVTNGIFSNEAEIFARRNNIELINGANLQGLMKKMKT
jgi:HJR/Mrr/RecB family endonuclease